eukprot:gene17536-19977_t
MSGNAEFLNGLKKTTVAREKQFQSKIWGTIFLVGSGVAMFYASDFMTRLSILGAAVVGLASLYFSNKATIQPTDYSKLRTSTSIASPTPVSAPRRNVATAVNPSLKREILSPDKANRDNGKHQDRQSADWNENFDVQSPQRIAHAVMSEMQQQQSNTTAMGPTGTGLLPATTLYANTNTAYVGKSNVANLGFQFTGNSYSAPLGSPIASSTAYSRNAGTAPGSAFGSTYQPPEQSAPVWHAYHSSPTSDSTAMRAVSPVGGHRTGAYGNSNNMYEEEDPLNEIVNRVSAGLDRADNSLGSPFSDRNLSINTFNNSGAAGGYSGAYTPNRGTGRSFTTPSSVRGRGGMGFTEDRMEHVLNKYLESQEQIVHEVTQELLRLLTQRASSQPAGAVPFLQSQEDVAKLKNLFELQADRQVMQNRSLLGLTELLRYCRSIGINEDLLRRYEAAVAVLQSPNHSSYSNPSTPRAPSFGHAHHTNPASSSMFGGSGLHSSAFSSSTSGVNTGSHGGVGGSLYSSSRAFGAGGPEPASSSGAFNSTRRSRR